MIILSADEAGTNHLDTLEMLILLTALQITAQDLNASLLRLVLNVLHCQLVNLELYGSICAWE